MENDVIMLSEIQRVGLKRYQKKVSKALLKKLWLIDYDSYYSLCTAEEKTFLLRTPTNKLRREFLKIINGKKDYNAEKIFTKLVEVPCRLRSRTSSLENLIKESGIQFTGYVIEKDKVVPKNELWRSKYEISEQQDLGKRMTTMAEKTNTDEITSLVPTHINVKSEDEGLKLVKLNMAYAINLIGLSTMKGKEVRLNVDIAETLTDWLSIESFKELKKKICDANFCKYLMWRGMPEIRSAVIAAKNLEDLTHRIKIKK